VDDVEELLQRAKGDGWAIYASLRGMPRFTDTVALFDRFGLLSEDEREELRADLSTDAAELLDEMVASVVARREALRPDLSEEEFQLVLDELEDLDLVESSWPGPSSAYLLFPAVALLTNSDGSHVIERRSLATPRWRLSRQSPPTSPRWHAAHSQRGPSTHRKENPRRRSSTSSFGPGTVDASPPA
jgi:hypothetical protein